MKKLLSALCCFILLVYPLTALGDEIKPKIDLNEIDWFATREPVQTELPTSPTNQYKLIAIQEHPEVGNLKEVKFYLNDKLYTWYDGKYLSVGFRIENESKHALLIIPWDTFVNGKSVSSMDIGTIDPGRTLNAEWNVNIEDAGIHSVEEVEVITSSFSFYDINNTYDELLVIPDITFLMRRNNEY